MDYTKLSSTKEKNKAYDLKMLRKRQIKEAKKLNGGVRLSTQQIIELRENNVKN